MLVAVVALLVLAYGGAYLTLYLLNRNAPPPPSLDRNVVPTYAPVLDGVWRTRDCAAFQIVGGWLLPASAALVRGERLASPLDLTKLKPNARPLDVTAKLPSGPLALSVRWLGSVLAFQGKTVRISLRREPGQSAGCTPVR